MRVAPPEAHLARLDRLRMLMDAESLGSLILTAPPSIAYLTGFFGSAGMLVVSKEGAQLIVDGRYAEAAQERGRDLDTIDIVMVPHGSGYEDVLVDSLGKLRSRRVGFEAGHITVAGHLDLVRRATAAGVSAELSPTTGLVEKLRIVKDSWEQATLREAGTRLSDVAKSVIPKALGGVSEVELAGQIDVELRRVGFAKPAFDTIVASGPNSAKPHYRCGARRLTPGDLVVMDFGGVLDGYCVDLTRTVAIGGANQRQRAVLEHVAAAQGAAFEGIAPGGAPEAIDERARDCLGRQGLGDAFMHGTGHGLGLEIHERPRVGPRRVGQVQEPLEAGMVFTLEPGAYFPGWGGVRIEDDVLVTSSGAEWLTDVPRMV